MMVQWVHLGQGRVLVASANGAWLQRAQLGSLALGETMPRWLEATPETTRHLLDGAIATAEREAPVVAQPPMSARRWAWHLVGQWYCAHHSIALLPGLIERFAALGRADLEVFTRLKLEEERGHDEFALTDLRTLGYDADRLVRELAPPPLAIAAVAYARDCAVGPRPCEFIGYAYALERLVLRLSPEWFASLDALLPAGADAASGLRAHATELDHEHVAEALEFIARLAAQDRAEIAVGCHRTAAICCETFPDLTEAELEDRLGRWQPEPAGAGVIHRQGAST